MWQAGGSWTQAVCLIITKSDTNIPINYGLAISYDDKDQLY